MPLKDPVARKAYMAQYAIDHCNRIKKARIQWAIDHPDRKQATDRAYRLRRDYGLTANEVDAMIAERGSRCDLCHQVARLCIDHNHDTNEVRGMLCGSCNKALGLLGDNIVGVQMAMSYLCSSGSRVDC